MINRFHMNKKPQVKLQLIQGLNPVVFSFNIRQDTARNVNSELHVHQEVELIHFHKGSGVEFVGDNVRAFNKNDILLIGSNLPHCFKFRDTESESTGKVVKPYSTVIHFNQDFWGKVFLDLPENAPIKRVLEQAKRGILLSKLHEPLVSAMIGKMVKAKGHYRISLLMDTLSLIGSNKQSQQLASFGFNLKFREGDRQRLSRIYDFAYTNFQWHIPLHAIAEVAGLAPNSFCRYFKKRTGKTFVQFLNEIKVCHACKCLAETDMSIKEICYGSGFNNFSSFHEAFKRSKGITPLEFRNNFLFRPR